MVVMALDGYQVKGLELQDWIAKVVLVSAIDQLLLLMLWWLQLQRILQKLLGFELAVVKVKVEVTMMIRMLFVVVDSFGESILVTPYQVQHSKVVIMARQLVTVATVAIKLMLTAAVVVVVEITIIVTITTAAAAIKAVITIVVRLIGVQLDLQLNQADSIVLTHTTTELRDSFKDAVKRH